MTQDDPDRYDALLDRDWGPVWDTLEEAPPLVLRDQLAGRRVRLVACSDPYTRLAPGALGTIALVDDAGTIHVDWDDGHALGLVPGEDRYELVDGARS